MQEPASTSHQTSALTEDDSAKSSGGWGRREIVTALLLAVAALSLRLFALSAQDLTVDEELSTGLPMLTYGQVFTDIANRPPLIFLLQKATMAITGKAGAFEIRLPSAILGALGAALLFLFGRRLTDYPTALTAGILLCLSHFHWTYSRDGRYYALLMLAALALLWCYWEVFERRKLWMALPLVLAAFALPLSHHTGYLYLAACGLAAPAFVAQRPWREWMRVHPRAALSMLAAGLLCGGIGALLVGPYIRPAVQAVFDGRGNRPLSPFFDISPAFLLHRFADVTGASPPLSYALLVLLAIGLAVSLWRRPAWGLLCVSVLAVPFALVWYFRPHHWWNAKYFIFMLPILLLLTAQGVQAAAGFLARPFRHGRMVPTAALSLLVLAWAFPNAQQILEDTRHPQQGCQQTGALLTGHVEAGGHLLYTWESSWRVLRNYYQLPIGPEAVHALENPPQTGAQADSAYLNAVPNTWYLHSGRNDMVSDAVSAFVLSNRLSRMAFDNAFLAFGPNLQRITFGETFPGAPASAGPLILNPGASSRMDILLPRPGKRAVLVGLDPAAQEGQGDAHIQITVGDTPPLECPLSGNGFAGYIDAPPGPTAVTIANPSKSTAVTIRYVEILPALDDAPLAMPAWDFYALEGQGLESTVWSEQRPSGDVLLRDFRHGHTLYYRLFVASPVKVSIQLEALNDPPGANVYHLFLPGVVEQAAQLVFDAEDGSISSRETPMLQLQRGVYTICVQYQGLPLDDMKALTEDFSIMTEERLQTPGLRTIALIPHGE